MLRVPFFYYYYFLFSFLFFFFLSFFFSRTHARTHARRYAVFFLPSLAMGRRGCVGCWSDTKEKKKNGKRNEKSFGAKRATLVIIYAATRVGRRGIGRG